MKKLYRSRTQKMLGGVLGGVAEYTGIDPTILRLIYAFITVFTGVAPGVLLYVIALFIIPLEPTIHHEAKN